MNCKMSSDYNEHIRRVFYMVGVSNKIRPNNQDSTSKYRRFIARIIFLYSLIIIIWKYDYAEWQMEMGV
jgi:hypothetical protein